jgi:hypothetical protein
MRASKCDDNESNCGVSYLRRLTSTNCLKRWYTISTLVQELSVRSSVILIIVHPFTLFLRDALLWYVVWPGHKFDWRIAFGRAPSDSLHRAELDRTSPLAHEEDAHLPSHLLHSPLSQMEEAFQLDWVKLPVNRAQPQQIPRLVERGEWRWRSSAKVVSRASVVCLPPSLHAYLGSHSLSGPFELFVVRRRTVARRHRLRGAVVVRRRAVAHAPPVAVPEIISAEFPHAKKRGELPHHARAAAGGLRMARRTPRAARRTRSGGDHHLRMHGQSGRRHGNDVSKWQSLTINVRSTRPPVLRRCRSCAQGMHISGEITADAMVSLGLFEVAQLFGLKIQEDYEISRGVSRGHTSRCARTATNAEAVRLIGCECRTASLVCSPADSQRAPDGVVFPR